MPEAAPYSGDIVDAHHHIWRVADLPWLSGPMVPRIFGPYEAIRRDYLIDEYAAEATACGITESVYVQTNWPLDRVVDEVRWLRDVHEETGRPSAVVAAADLFDDDTPQVLRRQAALTPLVRGIRQQLHWHERPEFRFATAPDRMKDPVLRKSLGAVAGLGWLFELQVFPEQMADAAELVAAFPDLTFVLVHAGMLIGEEYVEPWRAGLSALAELPNVVVKLTGQGTFVHRVDPELISFVAGEVLARFGAGRAMFGTNFPVERLWTTMPHLVGAWKDALAHLPPADQHAVFAGTARRVYGLGG
ncbi:amidohydrolase family protein [Nonomuraea sp. FMUSA5-5]|uniref:Amidohydrolase family protein n=1 Tax=Nonomuraea composti TaxID=2720023 RepID=A0ABX1B1R2_9ACTN|nr:amidohydrolase family protein [Nonomuraea sp. FMUSA5-5]NJP88933.1 amidohydrolase family protein [Nonomuraea sp. FMUSA5-5]